MGPRENGSPRTGEDAPAARPLRPCPRFATRNEWEAWLSSLTWEERLHRWDLDPPGHEYSEADTARAHAREERRRAQCWDPDPFSYSDDRRDGPWPRLDQIEAPALSNIWQMDPASGYSAGGFARRLRRVPHREWIEGRLPVRARRNPAARLAWLLEAIEKESASQRAALRRVLRERHGRLAEEERGATLRAMAWGHLLTSRAELQALRELAKEVRVEVPREPPQLALF